MLSMNIQYIPFQSRMVNQYVSLACSIQTMLVDGWGDLFLLSSNTTCLFALFLHLSLCHTHVYFCVVVVFFLSYSCSWLT